MTSKVIIIIMLVVLLALTNTIGLYAYHLTAEIDSLSEQLTTLRDEATASVGTVSSMLGTYTQQINAKPDIIDQEVQDNRGSILVSEEVVKRNSNLLSELEVKVVDIVEDLTEEKSWLQAGCLYEGVSQSVIEVSDGRNTIGSGFIYDDQGHVVSFNTLGLH